MSNDENYEVENIENISENPYCIHGPTILFNNKKKKFYACSACRDRKLCPFYADHHENKKFSSEKLANWLQIYSMGQRSYLDTRERKNEPFKLSADRRLFCQSCNQFIRDSNLNQHKEHTILKGITDDMMRQPLTHILKPIAVNSSNAQFVFDQQTTEFILDHVKKFSYDSILCIGCPSIFEKVGKLNMNRFLLDIDERFVQFYDRTEFLKFNMFNCHFFEPDDTYRQFLSKSTNLFIIIDPPYGGIVQLVAHTINKIINDFNKRQLGVFLVYPYFIQKWIAKWLPNFNMLDYKVSYENQKKFSTNKTVKKGSPARIYTNLASNDVQLPTDEGYKYCKLCDKYTYGENEHCFQCKTCPSKDGGKYRHCKVCKRCVKTSYSHCKSCKRCHLPTTCPTTTTTNKSSKQKHKKTK